MKKLTAAMLIITAAFFLGLGGVSKTLMADTSESDKDNRDVYLNIMTVNKPQYETVKKLAGDKHNVEYMFNNFNDMKNYKYDENTLNNISNMDLFFYSGAGNESASLNNMISELDKSSLGVVNLSRGIRELRYKVDGKDMQNPYYYLGIPEYKIMLYNTKSALQEKDPANREYYEANYNKLVKSIDDLKSTFDKETKELKKNTFILQDDKLVYFFKGLGIDFKVSPEKENIEEYAKNNNLNLKDIVFVQDTESKEDVKDIKVIKLDTYNDNKDFQEIIEYNIKQLEGLIDKK
ncbi:zinc ABC transporter substrate-binding protein [Clostridium sardiniense]|uniref:Zinc ABC transporter substrate-binding protein n=1 Tax=Clostridium sardiniense TaxID=29369 RepID=A0ABS7KYA4_CLOSR|nr:zinc ABC transporter substrate-binding protein [Clostridium sardiniense]MBY0755800.1 zinc ABC transporter substrate-binding protein [Clostridium sardiniense]MDQ0459972.1 ABC-type Zn uptake system ZnuABC Zn-binding protein ZnuA [Clostridium sardiniense]